MTNKTLAHNLVKLSEGLSSLPGHTLVVMHGRDGGMRHYTTVEPGNVFRFHSFFDGKKDLTGYHVNLAERLRHVFGGRYEHDDGVHTFSLEFELSFRVDSAELVVGLLKSDPLHNIESETRRVLGASVSRCPWTELQQIPDIGRHMLALEDKDDDGEVVSNLERLRRHAKAAGIDVRQVSLKLHLSDDDRKVAKERARIEQSKDLHSLKAVENSDLTSFKLSAMQELQRLHMTEQDLSFDLREQEAIRNARLTAFQALATHVKGIEEALGRAPESAKSMHDIQVIMSQAQDTFALLGGLVPRLGNERAKGQNEVNALPLSEAPKTLPKPVLSLSSALAREVQELVDLTSSLPLTASERQALLSAALHLLAESSHAKDERDVAPFQKRFDAQFRKHAQELPEESNVALRRFSERHA